LRWFRFYAKRSGKSEVSRFWFFGYASVYLDKLWGCLTLFHFPIARILEYKENWEELKKSDNPFAVVVMAHLKTVETKSLFEKS